MMIKDMPEDETVRVLEEFFESLSRLPEDPSYRIYFRCGVVPMQRTILSGNRVADAAKMAQALGTKKNETEIADLEAENASIEAQFLDPAVSADHIQLTQLGKRQSEIEARLAELYDLWEELSLKE
jgi:hypothetical protein